MQAVGMGSISSTGQMVSNMSPMSSSLLATVDQELANCRYVERLEMGGVDIHIINLTGEAWGTSQDIAILVNDWQGRDIIAPMLARNKVELEIIQYWCRGWWSIIIDLHLDSANIII